MERPILWGYRSGHGIAKDSAKDGTPGIGTSKPKLLITRLQKKRDLIVFEIALQDDRTTQEQKRFRVQFNNTVHQWYHNRTSFSQGDNTLQVLLIRNTSAVASNQQPDRIICSTKRRGTTQLYHSIANNTTQLQQYRTKHYYYIAMVSTGATPCRRERSLTNHTHKTIQKTSEGIMSTDLGQYPTPGRRSIFTTSGGRNDQTAVLSPGHAVRTVQRMWLWLLLLRPRLRLRLRLVSRLRSRRPGVPLYRTPLVVPLL